MTITDAKKEKIRRAAKWLSDLATFDLNQKKRRFTIADHEKLLLASEALLDLVTDRQSVNKADDAMALEPNENQQET